MRKSTAPAVLALVLCSAAALLPGTAGATFPGDNGRIAFDSNRTGNVEIYSMKPSGKDVRQLTDHPATDAFANWSPDGSRIVFFSRRDGNGEIYVMRADGSNVTRLTNHAALDTRPDWSPDGSRIVFVSTRDGGVHPISGVPLRRVYVMNADGSGLTRLTNPAEHLDNAPRFSPDGTRIAFLRVQANGHMAVYTIAADGSDERKLTPDALNAAEPDWSPDGTKIAFQNNTCLLEECADLECDILVMTPDGTGIRRLTHNEETRNGRCFLHPRYSPEGGKITFDETSVDLGADFDVLTMTATGHAVKNLTEDETFIDGSASWGSASAAPGD